MRKSLLEEAEELLAKEKMELAVLENMNLKAAINAQFLYSLKKYPVLIELLCTWFSVNTEVSEASLANTLLGLSEGTMLFTDNIGSPALQLIQEPTPVSEDGGVSTFTAYYAWAIKFSDVYGQDIYLIPYKDSNLDFAVSFCDHGERETYSISPKDIERMLAVSTIREYKKQEATE